MARMRAQGCCGDLAKDGQGPCPSKPDTTETTVTARGAAQSDCRPSQQRRCDQCRVERQGEAGPRPLLAALARLLVSGAKVLPEVHRGGVGASGQAQARLGEVGQPQTPLLVRGRWR